MQLATNNPGGSQSDTFWDGRNGVVVVGSQGGPQEQWRKLRMRDVGIERSRKPLARHHGNTSWLHISNRNLLLGEL